MVPESEGGWHPSLVADPVHAITAAEVLPAMARLGPETSIEQLLPPPLVSWLLHSFCFLCCGVP